MTIRSTQMRDRGAPAAPRDGVGAVQRALAELSSAQTLQRAAEDLGSIDPSNLSQDERDGAVIQALLDGLNASYACVGRWCEGAGDVVGVCGQRRSGALQESTSLDMSGCAWSQAVRRGETVALTSDQPTDSILEQLGLMHAYVEPFRSGGGASHGFVLVADWGTADAPSPAVRTFLEAVARWVDCAKPGADAPAGPSSRAEPSCEVDAEASSADAGRSRVETAEPDRPGDRTVPLLQMASDSIAGPAGGDLLASIFEHMDQGLVVIDHDLTILAVNGRAKELLHLPPGILMVGASMVDFFGFCAERGDYGPGDSEALAQERIAMARDVTCTHGVDRHLGDGRVVTCTRRTTGDGRIIVTYTDVTELRESEAALAQKTELLEATVQHMDQGLFAFDGDLRVLFANERAKALLGVPREFFEPGRNFEDIARFSAARGDYGDGDPEARLAEVLNRSRGDEWFTFVRRCPGGIRVMTRCHPRPEGGFVVTFTDITENRRQQEALEAVTDELRATSAQLDTAFSSMTQGLAMYDSDLRLIVCNRRFMELYDLPEELTVPGTELADIIRHKSIFQTGLPVEDSIVRRYDLVRARKAYVESGALPDGRVFELSHEPLEDGGSLDIFTDVTERRFHEQALRDASEALKQKSNQLERMFNNMDRAVGMFDADQRLIVCNQLYADTFPIPEALTQPGTPLADILNHCMSLVVESDAALIGEAHPNLKAGGGRREFRLQLRDGRVFEVVREPMEDGGSMAIYQDITDRDRAEQQMREYAANLEHQQNVLTTILENLDQGVSLVDQDLKMQAMNRRGMELLDFPEALMREGASLEDFFRYNAERGEYGPGDVSALVQSRMELARQFQPHKFERERPDGTIIEVLGTPLPKGRGFVTTYTDVTEMRRHQAEVDALTDQLRAANMQLDAAFNSMDQGLAMFDDEQRLVVRNKRYVEFFGLTEEMSAPGRTIEEITRYSIQAGNEAEPETIVERRVEIARSRERVVFHRRMRGGRTLEIIHEPLEDGGSIAIYLDVTARMEADQRLRSYTSKLEASNKELQDFAYVASHDLQEPLRKIEAFGDRLNRKCGERLGEDGRLYVSRMQDSSRRLRTLINDLLAYSRVTSNAKPFVDVDMNSIVEDVVFDMDTVIEEAGGTVTVDQMPILQADDAQMRQLIGNLISNAIKFRKPEVPPQVRISSSVIDDPTGEEGKDAWCEITVSDNGIGFSNKYADRIFTIFQRLHAQSSYEGTGIGLATCRKIVERHGGDISADGSPGESATFRIRLPLHQADDIASSAAIDAE